jgi:DNA-binding NarL/FixJ family response regulator
MPPTHSTEGLDAARVIREEFPQTAIVVLSAHVEVEHAMDLLASGERTGYARRAHDPLEDLTPREREVLALMAEGRSNAGIARQLWVTEGTVEKHVHHILGSLRLPESGDDHRRVLAVLTFLEAR